MQADWLQVVVPSVAALVSSIVGALVGGFMVKAVAREQSRHETKERRAERAYADLLAATADRRKLYVQQIDRKIELLKQAHALYELFTLVRGDPSADRQISIAFGMVKALGSISLDATEFKVLMAPFEALDSVKHGDSDMFAAARDSLQSLAHSLKRDVAQFSRITISGMNGEPQEATTPPVPGS